MKNDVKKTHYKMYKDGKRWLFAGIVAVSVFFVEGTLNNNEVHADSDVGISQVSSDGYQTRTVSSESGSKESAASSTTVSCKL